MNFELVCAWMVVGALIGAILHGVYRRTPLFDAASFGALGAVLCGLSAWTMGFSEIFNASLYALGGALLGVVAAPRSLVRRAQLNLPLGKIE